MSNSQMWLAIGIPSLLILIAMWRTDKRFDSIEARLTVIEADMRRFYQILGEHNKAIEILEGKNK